MLRGEYVARQCGLWLCASAACIQTVFDPLLLLDVVSGPCSGRAAPVPGEDLVPGGRRPVRAKGVHRAPAQARAGPSSSSNRLHGPSRLQIGGRAGIAGTRCPRAPAPRRGRRFRRLRAHGSPARRQCGERGGGAPARAPPTTDGAGRPYLVVYTASAAPVLVVAGFCILTSAGCGGHKVRARSATNLILLTASLRSCVIRSSPLPSCAVYVVPSPLPLARCVRPPLPAALDGGGTDGH